MDQKQTIEKIVNGNVRKWWITSLALIQVKTSLGWDPTNGIDMTTASESAGRQIQNNRNPIIKIPQTSF